MKLVFILALSCLMQISAPVASTGEEATLVVHLKNIDSDKGGKIYIALFNKKETFMTENRYDGKVIDLSKDWEESVSFSGLPEGDYVLSAYHDANDNGQMDFDSTGMPLEAWATSGNPNPYGPPSWEDTKVRLSNEEVSVDLNFKN